MEWDARKIYTIKKDAENGAMLDLFIVVEMLRFFFYLWFVVIILVGLVITLAAVEIDYTAVLKSLGGAAGVCAFFDFPLPHMSYHQCTRYFRLLQLCIPQPRY